MLKIISWNLAHRAVSWQELLKSGADIALVQEATVPPHNVAKVIEVDDAPWQTQGVPELRKWRTAVVQLNRDLDVRWPSLRPLCDAHADDIGVSRLGTLAVAVVTEPSGESITLASMYAAWDRPHSKTKSGWILSDPAAHRLISDLSALIGQEKKHRIIAAGDLNILHGYGEHGSSYWAARYRTVFDRMQALGLLFVGPQFPNGQQAEPWPEELPKDSANVPTYYSNQQTPETASRQLDFVFASEGLSERVKVTALNEVDAWGPSDHCAVMIEVS